MRVRISRSWDNRAPYQGGGRCASPFPEKQRHQPFVFGQPGTRRAKRRRPRPLHPLPRTRQAKRRRPAPLQPLSARGERSDAARGRLRPPHPRRPRTRRASAASSGARRPRIPPACAASPKTQGSPRPSPERFRRRGRRPRKPPEAVSRTAAMRRGQAKGKAGGFPVGSKAQLSPTSASEQTHR